MTITVLKAPPGGDLDNNYKIELLDAIIAMQVLSKGVALPSLRSNYAISEANVSGDNLVGMEELIYILQTLANVK